MIWEKKETFIGRVLNSDKYTLESPGSGSEIVRGILKYYSGERWIGSV